MTHFSCLAVPAAFFAMAGAALAADHQVQMLNRGENGMMVFEPAFVRAELGDTVTFVPTEKSHLIRRTGSLHLGRPCADVRCRGNDPDAREHSDSQLAKKAAGGCARSTEDISGYRQ